MSKKQRNGYRVPSRKGKNLGGPYRTLEEAKMSLRQVEFLAAAVPAQRAPSTKCGSRLDIAGQATQHAAIETPEDGRPSRRMK